MDFQLKQLNGYGVCNVLVNLDILRIVSFHCMILFSVLAHVVCKPANWPAPGGWDQQLNLKPA